MGCNVGVAALHFAQTPGVVHVEAFEPFRQTVAQARRNVALNPAPAAKITIHAHGVAGATRTETLDYSYTWKGHAGVAGMLGHVVREGRLATDDIARERIELRGACEVLDGVIAAHPGLDVVAKIDCEGAEYEIIEALASAGRLRDVAMFVIEWHTHGSERFEELFGASGFDVVSESDPSGLAGIVRAVRRS
jgi:FkbM family methyltransferase